MTPGTAPARRRARRRGLGAIAAVLAASLPGAPAGAADPEGRFAVKGVGRAACAAFIEALETSPEAYRQFGGWIEGYLTGLNQERADTFDMALFEDSDTISLYVARYCRRNPEQAFAAGARAVAEALSKTRLTRAEGYASVSEDPAVVLYESALAAVERRLRDLGHLEAGSPVPETELRAALRSFQREAGLGESGLPDQPTLVKLLRDQDP